MNKVFDGCLTRLVVAWIAITGLFFALRLLPGDAITAQLITAGGTQEQIEAERAALGLDDPFYVQYGRFVGSLLAGDLGDSLSSGQPVSVMIAQQMLPTAALATGALIVAVLVGSGLGIIAALNPHRLSGEAARALIALSLAMPIFWSGILAILLFSVTLNWLPATGAGGLDALVLPVAVLGFHTSGAIAAVTQSSVEHTLHTDFVRTAYSKGLRYRRILVGHVLRAGMIPVVSVVALQAGFLFSGTVVTETLFVRPGLGRLLLDATLRRDYPVIQGVVIVMLLVFTLANGLADLAYRLLDPRVRQ